MVWVTLGVFIRRLPRGSRSPPWHSGTLSPSPDVFHVERKLRDHKTSNQLFTRDGKESPVQILDGQLYGRSQLMSLLYLGFCTLRLYLRSTFIVPRILSFWQYRPQYRTGAENPRTICHHQYCRIYISSTYDKDQDRFVCTRIYTVLA